MCVSLLRGIHVLIKQAPERSLTPSPSEVTVKRQPFRKEALNKTQIRHKICWHHNLGLPRLQNYEKLIFVVYKLSTLYCVSYKCLNKLHSTFYQKGNKIKTHEWLKLWGRGVVYFFLNMRKIFLKQSIKEIWRRNNRTISSMCVAQNIRPKKPYKGGRFYD